MAKMSIRFLTYDVRQTPIRSCAASMPRGSNCPTAARDFITLEMWEQLNSLFLKMRGRGRRQNQTIAGVSSEHINPFRASLIGGITDAHHVS